MRFGGARRPQQPGGEVAEAASEGVVAGAQCRAAGGFQGEFEAGRDLTLALTGLLPERALVRAAAPMYDWHPPH
jgi:hypothetical protein